MGCAFLLIAFISAGCKNEQNTAQTAQTSVDSDSRLSQELESINPDYEKKQEYIIYQIVPSQILLQELSHQLEESNQSKESKDSSKSDKSNKASKDTMWLFVSQNQKGILSAVFRRNHQNLKCALKNTLKSLENGVLNGQIDCQKQFIAQIQQGKIIQPKITISKISEILHNQKEISNISSVSKDYDVALESVREFALYKHTSQQMLQDSALRIDFLCSDTSKIQHAINQIQAKNFQAYNIDSPTNCDVSQAQFDAFIKQNLQTRSISMKNNGLKNSYELEYMDYSVDFFDDRFLQLHRTKFVDMGGAHGVWSSEYMMFDYEGHRINLHKDVFDTKADGLLHKLQSKHTAFLEAHQECKIDAKQDFDYTNVSVAFGYDGVYFMYAPYVLAPYSCGEVRLKFGFDEIKDFIKKDSRLFEFVNEFGISEPKQADFVDTLYLECAKCEISTLYTQDQILELRNSLDDEEFYHIMSHKELDEAHLKQYDISIKPSIYNGDYAFIDFNHKYLLPLESLKGSHYILYQEGKKPYCIKDKNSNAEIDKYFGISNFIELKVLNRVEKIEISQYLKSLNIDMSKNECATLSREIK